MQVIRISGGVKCQGAALRDVGVYAVSVAAVGLVFHSGHVSVTQKITGEIFAACAPPHHHLGYVLCVCCL